MSQTPACVIMAAGEGSRMRPLTETRPKPMLPLANKPMLEHLILECASAGVKAFVLVVGYHEEQIHDYFGDGSKWDIGIRYAVQRRPRGTADAVKQALPFLDGPFLVMNGDILLGVEDIAPLVQAGESTLSLIELEDVTGMGVVELDGHRVARLHEKSLKPPTHLANAGVYYFTRDIVPMLENTPPSPRGEYELTDTIQLMIDAGLPVGYRLVNSWRDVGYSWDLLAANEAILADMESRVEGTVEAGAVVKGPVQIGAGSVIRSGSYITGPVVIGRNCDIGPHCYIRPATAIGDNCHIGAGVEVKNSIVMSDSKIPHLSYVGDSVIGQHCNLGAGTQIANLRFDHQAIRVQERPTGRKKLGAIIGDHVSTGVNASINPGTLIGSGSFVGPGALAAGVIAPGTRVH